MTFDKTVIALTSVCHTWLPRFSLLILAVDVLISIFFYLGLKFKNKYFKNSFFNFQIQSFINFNKFLIVKK